MDPYVTIVCPEQGWILERLSRNITSRLDYTRIAPYPDTHALINYYVTYAIWQYRSSPIEIGYFTHIEPTHVDKFFDVARNVDYCICHAELYAQKIREAGILNVTAINPGIDLESYKPKLQIGVVGRTYKSGRKGEGLVRQLLDIDWIDWHFTGEGWPGKALNLAPEAMPEFYRKMDYILVPASYEGGPMCVAEALACGTPVIAPPVGWVPQLEHIEYRTNDAEDLRRVLSELFEEKKARAEKVAHITWDAWAEGHDRIFRKLAGDRQIHFATKVEIAPRPAGKKIAVMFHTDEKKMQGGPQVRVPRTARLLREWKGYDTVLCSRRDPLPQDADLAHLYAWQKPGGEIARSCIRNNIPYVVSPIFMGSFFSRFFPQIEKIFKFGADDAERDARLAELPGIIARRLKAAANTRRLGPEEQHYMQEVLGGAECVVCLSEYERRLMDEYGFKYRSSAIVHNPVDVERYRDADPDLFRNVYNVSDYVLCVGRIEDRKNQLLLAWALRDAGIPIVMIGHVLRPGYYSLLKQFGSKNLTYIERLPNGSDLLASAYAGARVWCLPSWSEGAALANLEAAASGCSMVLADRPSEREYFGDYARYCNPGDFRSIRDQVLAAWENPFSQERKREQQDFVASRYSWDNHISATAKVYEEVLSKGRDFIRESAKQEKLIYFDVTHMIIDPTVNGSTRVERELAKNMASIAGSRLRFIAWDAEEKIFREIPYSLVIDLTGDESRNVSISLGGFGEANFQKGSHLASMGGNWTVDSVYTRALMSAAKKDGLLLHVCVHDLIPILFPRFCSKLFHDDFLNNLLDLAQVATSLIAVSENTAKDLNGWLSQELSIVPPIRVSPNGEHLSLQDMTPVRPVRLPEGKPFVLYVAGLNLRKNHGLIFRIWDQLIQMHGIENVPYLVLVGYDSFGHRDIKARINGNANLRSRVILLQKITEVELAWLYSRCLFTVYPSLYEGWGLPVAESLAAGKICVASNTSSIPEIGAKFTDLIDPAEYAEWYQRINDYIFRQGKREEREREIAGFKPITWKDSAERLKFILDEDSNRAVEYELAAPGVEISDFSRPFNRRHLGTGWNSWDRDGNMLSKGMPASLLLEYRAPAGPVVFKAQVKGQPGVIRMSVLINGELAARKQISDVNFTEISVFAKPRITDKELQGLEITLVADGQKAPGQRVENSNAGFSLKSFMIADPFASFSLPADVTSFISSLDSPLGAAMYHTLARRKDIRELSCSENGLQHLLLWAWCHGIGEERELGAFRKNLGQLLAQLHSIPWQGRKVEGYSLLLHMIWQTRPDLRRVNIDTEEGQKLLVEWFASAGRSQYNLPLEESGQRN